MSTVLHALGFSDAALHLDPDKAVAALTKELESVHQQLASLQKEHDQAKADLAVHEQKDQTELVQEHRRDHEAEGRHLKELEAVTSSVTKAKQEAKQAIDRANAAEGHIRAADDRAKAADERAKAADERFHVAESRVKAAEAAAEKASQALASYQKAEEQKDRNEHLVEAARDDAVYKAYQAESQKIAKRADDEKTRADKAEAELAALREAVAKHKKVDEAAQAQKNRLLAAAAQREAKAKQAYEAHKAADTVRDAGRDARLHAVEASYVLERMFAHGLQDDLEEAENANNLLQQHILSLHQSIDKFQSDVAGYKKKADELQARVANAESQLKAAEAKHELDIQKAKRETETEKARFADWKKADAKADKLREEKINKMQTQLEKDSAEHKKFLEYIKKDGQSDAKREELLKKMQAEVENKHAQVLHITKERDEAIRALEKAELQFATLDGQYHHLLEQKKAEDEKLHNVRHQLAAERIQCELKEQTIARLEGALAEHDKEIREWREKASARSKELSELTAQHGDLHQKVHAFTGALADLHRLSHHA